MMADLYHQDQVINPVSLYVQFSHAKITITGCYLVHKDVHFDPFWLPLTPKDVQRGDNDVHRNFEIFLFSEVNVSPILNQFVKMSLRSCQ